MPVSILDAISYSVLSPMSTFWANRCQSLQQSWNNSIIDTRETIWQYSITWSFIQTDFIIHADWCIVKHKDGSMKYCIGIARQVPYSFFAAGGTSKFYVKRQMIFQFSHGEKHVGHSFPWITSLKLSNKHGFQHTQNMDVKPRFITVSYCRKDTIVFANFYFMQQK